MIKSQDVVIALKLLPAEAGGARVTYAGLAREVGVSASEAHAAVARGLESGLLRPSLGGGMPQTVKRALRDFLIFGLPYVWPAKRGAIARGIATATSHPPVSTLLNIAAPALRLVWASPVGDLRGETVPPLYSKAATMAPSDPELHEWLALIDILRLKSGREVALAREIIERRLF